MADNIEEKIAEIIESASDTKSFASALEEAQNALKSGEVASALNRMTADPNTATKMMKETMEKVTPEMMEQVRKLAAGGQGQQIAKELQKKGVDVNSLRSQMLDYQRAMRNLSGKTMNTKKIMFINASRQARLRTVPSDGMQNTANSLLKCSNAVELSCSRLAVGALVGATIKVWTNPDATGKNKRSSKIVGFPIGSEILIVKEDGDLTEAELASAEALLA